MTNKQELIRHIDTKGKDRNWLELAKLYNIKPEGTPSQRTKAANDIVRSYNKNKKKLNSTLYTGKAEVTPKVVINSEYDEFLKWKALKDAKIIKSKSKTFIEPYTKGDPNNVLVLGDLHSPWILEGYLEFNRELQEKYNCGTVIFIGDIVDGHSWSFHEHSVDGLSVAQEINKAIEQLQPFYYTFPRAVVLYGNHDLLVARKAKAAGLSELFIKDFGQIIKAPSTWTFTHEFEKDNVVYIHGSFGNAFKRAKERRCNIVQGHLHSESFVQWSVSEKDAIFGLQVGCGIDREAYAFEYAKPFPRKPIISSGLILNKGTLPIVQLMPL